MVTAPGVQVENLSFSIGEFAMRDLSIAVRHGEHFVLTGPNGAGKTILVKLLAGLLRPTGGTIHINRRAVTDLPPWKRGIGYVPQEGLLFPNYTVERNIDFGLRMRHVSAKERKEQTQRAAELLGIIPLLKRSIRGLSGGEQQKVALARALVISPSVLLLDEPVSAIDEDTRDPLCRELKRIQRALGITTLHVSHNQRETALVADRVGVLEGGVVHVMPAPD